MLMNAERPPEDPAGEAQPGGKGIAFVLGGIFMLVGGLIIYQAIGGPELFGRSLVSPWVSGSAGLVFFCGGLGFVLAALGAAKVSGNDWNTNQQSASGLQRVK